MSYLLVNILLPVRNGASAYGVVERADHLDNGVLSTADSGADLMQPASPSLLNFIRLPRHYAKCNLKFF
jgi:hypothetical protein